MLRVHAGGREGLLPKPHKPCWLSQFGSIPSSLISRSRVFGRILGGVLVTAMLKRPVVIEFVSPRGRGKRTTCVWPATFSGKWAQGPTASA